MKKMMLVAVAVLVSVAPAFAGGWGRQVWFAPRPVVYCAPRYYVVPTCPVYYPRPVYVAPVLAPSVPTRTKDEYKHGHLHKRKVYDQYGNKIQEIKFDD